MVITGSLTLWPLTRSDCSVWYWIMVGHATHSSAFDTWVCVGSITLRPRSPPPVCPIAARVGVISIWFPAVVTVCTGAPAAAPTLLVVFVTVSGAMTGEATPYPCFAVTV